MNLAELAPPETDDPLMLAAWVDCLRWAIQEPYIIKWFRAETGNQWTPGLTPIESMIDDATGVAHDFIVSFVVWFNFNVWGQANEPS